MAKNITFNTDARAKLAKGVNTLADAVTVTIGPRAMSPCSARSVLRRSPTTAFLSPRRSSLRTTSRTGRSAVKEVATKTNDTVGDGTTTATRSLKPSSTTVCATSPLAPTRWPSVAASTRPSTPPSPR